MLYQYKHIISDIAVNTIVGNLGNFCSLYRQTDTLESFDHVLLFWGNIFFLCNSILKNLCMTLF